MNNALHAPIPLKRRRIFFFILIILAGTALLAAYWQMLPGSRPNDAEDRKWQPYLTLVNDVDRGDVRAVTEDLGRGTNPNKLPDDGYAIGNEEDMAALCVAAGNGSIAVVNLLLKRGADPNIGDGWDGDPLTAAAAGDHVDVMKILLARGAKVAYDRQGDSDALWRAAVDGKVDALKFLLSRGANPNMANDIDGKRISLLSVTEEFHQDEATRLLRQAGAKD